MHTEDKDVQYVKQNQDVQNQSMTISYKQR